jgi:hypothetical protein
MGCERAINAPERAKPHSVQLDDRGCRAILHAKFEAHELPIPSLAKTATPEVVDPISSKHAAITRGGGILIKTIAIPRGGFQHKSKLSRGFYEKRRAIGLDQTLAQSK